MQHVEVGGLAGDESIYTLLLLLVSLKTHDMVSYGGIWGSVSVHVTALRGHLRNLNIIV